MKQPEQINLEDKYSLNLSDIEKLKSAFKIDSVEEIIELLENNSIIKIADTLDFEYAYEDYIKSNLLLDYITYFDFIKELNKGYGISEINEISRLLVLSNGIYYDNCYC